MSNLAPKAVIAERKISASDSTPSVFVEVHFPNAGVDRPHTYSCSCGNAGPKARKLAERLARATEAGKAFPKPEIRTDNFGKTYVTHDCKVLGRRLNADLKRLGF